MKHTLSCLLVLLCISANAFAQPTLTAADNNPVVGDQFRYRFCDVVGVSSGAAGAGVTWDMSAISVLDSTLTEIEYCTATPFCDSFPGSDVVVKQYNVYTYYSSSASHLLYLGYGTGTSTSRFIGGSNVVLQYPANYMDSWISTFSLPLPGHNNRMTDTSVVDGWGTLILPNGTHTNVLRVYSISNFKDTVPSFTPPLITEIRSEGYSWYTPGFHLPLLQHRYGNTSSSYGLNSVSYYSDMPSATVANATSERHVVTFPNPAGETLFVKMDNAISGAAATITLTDMTGRIIMNHICKTCAGNAVEQVDIRMVPTGIYLLRVQTSAGQYVQKVNIQR